MTLTFQHLWDGPNGDTAIVGSGLRVYTILGEYEMGRSAETIADQHDIPIAAVYEALAYAAEHPEEMEAIHRAERRGRSEDDGAASAAPSPDCRRSENQGRASSQRADS